MAGQLKIGGNVIATHAGSEGAGTVTLDSSTLTIGSNTTIQGAMNAGSITSAVAFPAGHVIQSKTLQGGLQSTTTSTSFDNRLTGIDLTITPRFGSSKILLIASFDHYASGDYGVYDFYKNASDFSETYNLSGQPHGLVQSTAQSKWLHTTMTFEDPISENSTTTKTYSISFRSYGSGTTYVGWGSNGLVVMTIQEIAG